MNLVISPHFDDAIYSMGAYMSAMRRVTVVTVYGQALTNITTAYDSSCGFGSSTEAIEERRAENHRALTLLQASGSFGPFYDKQYGVAHNMESVASYLKETLDNTSGLEEVYIPLGIEHPDHVMAAQAALLAAKRKRAKTIMYEDLPYRVQYPEQTQERLDQVRETAGLELIPAGGDMNIKRAAAECYRSQISDDVRPCLYVPERLWRVQWK